MTTLSTLGQIVRRNDPDRFFTALFAPPAARETLFTLYAFNHELARAREAVREPMAALIRLQWWREVLEGKRVRHEVATPLGEALDDARLPRDTLGAMLDAREAETDAIPDAAAFEAYVLGTAGNLMAAAGLALGLADPHRLQRPGAAYGVAGILRSVPALARQGRCLLPEDAIAAAGLTAATVIAGKADPAALAIVQGRLAALGRDMLHATPGLPRPTLAAALPLVLARRDLRRAVPPPMPRGIGDRLAVLWAWSVNRP